MTMLSIIMPVYNESATIRTAVERVLFVDYPCPVELIVVDDGSQDDTAKQLADLAVGGVHVVRHSRNRGKGAAVRTGVDRAVGTHMIILDADLEYSPGDIVTMLLPVTEGRADHVFGSRVFGMNTRFPSFRYAAGGRLLTLLANALYDSCLTDLHTCLKLIPLRDFRALSLSENGFGLDTELTARLLRGGVRPYEVPVTYHGRPFEEGKKITWQDGWHSLKVLARVRRQPPPDLPRVPRQVSPTVVPTAVPNAWTDSERASRPTLIRTTKTVDGVSAHPDDGGFESPAVAL
jgi:dolichol-phosphate hexosyltransferase